MKLFRSSFAVSEKKLSYWESANNSSVYRLKHSSTFVDSLKHKSVLLSHSCLDKSVLAKPISEEAISKNLQVHRNELLDHILQLSV